MSVGPKLSATAIFFSGLLLCGAPALAAGTDDAGAAATANTNDASATTGQSAGNAATAGGNSASSQFAHEFPFTANEGTMAESAKTTALATSTYHQNSGILPGIR
jgi:hypothetical protein